MTRPSATWWEPALQKTCRVFQCVRATSRLYTTARSQPRYWTGEEVETLKRMAKAQESIASISAKLGRSETSVMYTKAKYGLTKKPHKWTAKEDTRLLDARASGEQWSDIVISFPDMELSALQNRYYTLRGHRIVAQTRQPWTKEEDSKLLVLVEVKRLRIVQAAKEFPIRTPKGLRARYSKIRPRAQRIAFERPNSWQLHETQRLAKLVAIGWTSEQTAGALGRIVSAVKAQRARIKASQATGHDRRGRWTDDEKAKLCAWSDEGHSAGEIAKRLGRPIFGVYLMLHREGVKLSSDQKFTKTGIV